VLSTLQKHYVVWPSEEDTTRHYRKFDRVVGLVPQSICLYKTYTYQAAVVTREEVELCVKSELESELLWDDYQYFSIIQSVGDEWVASVWVWSAADVAFSNTVTHIIPALAYEFGLVEENRCVVIHQEGDERWVAFIDSGIVSKVIKCKPSLERIISQQINHFSTAVYGEANSSFEGVELRAFDREVPKVSVLNLGKLPVYQDISNPKTFYKPICMVILLGILALIIDYSIIQYKNSRVSDSLTVLQSETADLVKIRSQDADTLRVVNAIASLKQEQHQLAHIINMMLEQLPKDVVLSQLTYSSDALVITGKALEPLKVIDVVTTFNGVESARLIGDVVPIKDDDRQAFKMELGIQ
jgi:Fimbrial assembly protein (PilN).